MIRPRGGDFLYSDQEVEVMRKDIELMKSHGADGLVLGALTEDGRVDAELCMELLGSLCTLFDLIYQVSCAKWFPAYIGLQDTKATKMVM